MLHLADGGTEIAVALNSGHIPTDYLVFIDEFTSIIDEDTLAISMYIIAGIITVFLLLAVYKFKLRGVYSAILQIGYIASLLILVRLTNVIITPEGIAGVVISIAINYIAMYMLLDNMKKEETSINIAMKNVMKKLIMYLIPVYIFAVVLSFATFANVASFGMGLVWGIIVFYVYNLIFSRSLLKG